MLLEWPQQKQSTLRNWFRNKEVSQEVEVREEELKPGRMTGNNSTLELELVLLLSTTTQ